MQEQGVEESDGPGHLVGENHTTLRDTKTRGLVSKLHQTHEMCVCVCVFVAYQAQSCFIPGAEAQVSALTLLQTQRSRPQ